LDFLISLRRETRIGPPTIRQADEISRMWKSGFWQSVPPLTRLPLDKTIMISPNEKSSR
jgi:hypothetical protein